MGKKNSHRLYFFTVTFSGVASLTLLLYGLHSPYWFLISPRAHNKDPATRVLGLVSLLEGKHGKNISWLWASDAFSKREEFDLALRRKWVCDYDNMHERGTENDQHTQCGLDCEDIVDLKSIRVPCKDTDDGNDWNKEPVRSLVIPIPPAERYALSVQAGRNMIDAFNGSDISILKYSCGTSTVDRWFYEKCPRGYEKCGSLFVTKRVGTCPDGSAQKGCCIVKSEVGQTLYNVTKTPTYVQVYGWAQWQVKDLLSDVDRADRWCSIGQLRCALLRGLEENGARTQTLMLIACGCILLATILSMLRARIMTIPLIVLLFCSGWFLATYSILDFRNRTHEIIGLHMTKRDTWQRTHVHPMKGYDDDGRDIMKGWPKRFGDSKAEWVYLWVNAHIDFTTISESAEFGYSRLWAFWFSLTGACLAGNACIWSCELILILKVGVAPVSTVLGGIVLVVAFPFAKFKYFIDEYVAAYPVLFIYPWQKLYPCAFTAGTWLCWPFDQLWDDCLMMPVHLVRALWDYVSCQDICSPQEKKILAKWGIMNDRLRSLLCSRRSYFVLMSTMGCVNFVVNVQNLLEISNRQTHYREVSSRSLVYPDYYCTRTAGECPVTPPDVSSLGNYFVDMLLRLYGIIEEAVNGVETTQAAIEWFGGLVSLCCSIAALSYWTSFTISRRFCLIGWIAMMMTPACTAVIAANTWVEWDKTEHSIITMTAEVWEDINLFVATQPCTQVTDQLVYLQTKMYDMCAWKRTIKIFAPDSVTKGCDQYRDFYGKPDRIQYMNTISSWCATTEALMKDGPKTRGDFEAHMKLQVPFILNMIRIFVGVRAGIQNVMRILPAVVSMVPALMQGGLMVKNLVPRQSLPAILTTLPWVYTTVVWVQYQLYYQIMNDWLFLIAALALSFGPMVYYIYGKYYDLHQPMCDQQSITLTFRIWYYALILSLITPYVLLVIYITWFNEFMDDQIYSSTIGILVSPSVGTILAFLSAGIMGFAYSLQAGIDWFVDELVLHHMAQHAPLVIATTKDVEEARKIAKQLHTQIDVDSIQDGTYVCGGLSDLNAVRPPTEGCWRHKAETYAISLCRKDWETLDSYAVHIREDKTIPEQLEKGREFFYRWHSSPEKWKGEEGYDDVQNKSMGGQGGGGGQWNHHPGDEWSPQNGSQRPPTNGSANSNQSFETGRQHAPTWGVVPASGPGGEIQMNMIRSTGAGSQMASMMPNSGGQGAGWGQGGAMGSNMTSQVTSSTMGSNQTRLLLPTQQGPSQVSSLSSGAYGASPYGGTGTPHNMGQSAGYGQGQYPPAGQDPNGQQYPNHWG